MAPLERSVLAGLRKELMAQATGAVLELGAGTGANLPFYDSAVVTDLTLSDLELHENELRRKLTEFKRDGQPPVRLVSADAEDLPFPDASFDTVVFTLLFCSIPNPPRALAEIRRVLKPEGRVLFIEHVLPVGRPRLEALANSLTPIWMWMAGGCHLNRDTPTTLVMEGFRLNSLLRRSWSLIAAGVAEVR